MKQTHKMMILSIMRRDGKITPMDAWNEIGCTKLATRIGELKKDGYSIVGTRTNGTNRFGKPCHYTTYRLRESNNG